ncbi:glycosyltransferase [Treponema sp. TIM-1]|uniref:glycosyltransferase n=1 Tax=Treponema sp. TIM-1 TaxID=2898417 RepID=UPI003980B7AE
MISAAIVIWYNPKTLGEAISIKNILTYSDFCKKVYIIDNSIEDNSKLADQIPNSRYIPNFENLGIARALNQGCEAAVNDGHIWAMTMDQDSSWDSKYISEYINEATRIYHIDNSTQSFSPNTVHQNEVHSILGTIKHNLLKKRRAEKKDNENEFEYIDRVISSGNIINLEMWKTIGGFNNELFINDVDYDFCYRLTQKGYKIVKIHKCNMNHVEGEPRKTFFPHAFWYHKERIYYLVRNKYYILKNYPQFAKKYKYKQTIKRIIFEKFFFLEFDDLTYVLKGISDGRHNIYGKFYKEKKNNSVKE